jgi:hypothetical protein
MMDLLRASAYAHIVLSILLMGFALFWLFMEAALRKRHGAAQGRELLQVLARAQWPPGGVPAALRLPLPWLSWLVIAALVVTGLPGAGSRGAPDTLGWVKLALFAAIVAIQFLLARELRTPLVRTQFVLVAAVIVVSSWAIR